LSFPVVLFMYVQPLLRH